MSGVVVGWEDNRGVKYYANTIYDPEKNKTIFWSGKQAKWVSLPDWQNGEGNKKALLEGHIQGLEAAYKSAAGVNHLCDPDYVTELGFAIKQAKQRLSDLVAEGVADSTDVSNPPDNATLSNLEGR